MKPASKWHANITEAELHWRLSCFVGHYNSHAPIEYINKAAHAFYTADQFRVCGTDFITWAYLDVAQTYAFLSGDYTALYDSIDAAEGKILWVTHSSQKGRYRDQIKALRHNAPGYESAYTFMVRKDGTAKVHLLRLI